MKNILAKLNQRNNKTIGIIYKLHDRHSYSLKSLIRSHLDYGDVIYDKAFNESFHAKLESLQYDTTLAITGAIRWSSTENIYEELDLESRRWYRKMIFLYKLLKSESPSYLFNTIPNSNTQRQTRNAGNIPCFVVKYDYFKNSFFSFCNNWVE